MAGGAGEQLWPRRRLVCACGVCGKPPPASPLFACPPHPLPPPSHPRTRAQGGRVEVGAPTGRWQLVVTYRGRHDPLCVTYLAALQVRVCGWEGAWFWVEGGCSEAEGCARALVLLAEPLPARTHSLPSPADPTPPPRPRAPTCTQHLMPEFEELSCDVVAVSGGGHVAGPGGGGGGQRVRPLPVCLPTPARACSLSQIAAFTHALHPHPRQPTRAGGPARLLTTCAGLCWRCRQTHAQGASASRWVGGSVGGGWVGKGLGVCGGGLC